MITACHLLWLLFLNLHSVISKMNFLYPEQFSSGISGSFLYEWDWHGLKLILCELQDLACVWCRLCISMWAAVCVYLTAGSSVSVFLCLARIDIQTGLISRDLWALTGCRLVSTATTKGWRRFTYSGGELHTHAPCHFAHRDSPNSRHWEVPVWSWEWKRGQHTVSVARCLWWVYEVNIFK